MTTWRYNCERGLSFCQLSTSASSKTGAATLEFCHWVISGYQVINYTVPLKEKWWSRFYDGLDLILLKRGAPKAEEAQNARTNVFILLYTFFFLSYSWLYIMEKKTKGLGRNRVRFGKFQMVKFKLCAQTKKGGLLSLVLFVILSRQCVLANLRNWLTLLVAVA